MGAGGPRLARPARDDDRALRLAVDAQRRGQHVGQAVGVGDAAGDAVGDALVGAVPRGRGVRRPTRADGQPAPGGWAPARARPPCPRRARRTGPDEPVGRHPERDELRVARRIGLDGDGGQAAPSRRGHGQARHREVDGRVVELRQGQRRSRGRGAGPGGGQHRLRGRGPRAGAGRPRRDRRRSRRPAPRRSQRRSRPARPSATAHAGSGRTTRPPYAGCPRRRRRAPARGWPAGRPGRRAPGPRCPPGLGSKSTRSSSMVPRATKVRTKGRRVRSRNPVRSLRSPVALFRRLTGS